MSASFKYEFYTKSDRSLIVYILIFSFLFYHFKFSFWFDLTFIIFFEFSMIYQDFRVYICEWARLRLATKYFCLTASSNDWLDYNCNVLFLFFLLETVYRIEVNFYALQFSPCRCSSVNMTKIEAMKKPLRKHCGRVARERNQGPAKKGSNCRPGRFYST